MPKVTIDVNHLTLGDMERLETGRVTDMLAVFDRHLQVEGVAAADVPATIRAWTLTDLSEISAAIGAQVQAQTNPERQGKN